MSPKFPFFHHRQHDTQNPIQTNQPVSTAPHLPPLSNKLLSGDNIFAAIANDPPPIATTPSHPVPRSNIRTRTSPVSDTQLSALAPVGSTPLETNRFYSNLFLGSQSCPAWSQPYSIWWSKGRGNCQSYGMSITHIERDSLAYGPTNSYNCCSYFFGAIGKQNSKCSNSHSD